MLESLQYEDNAFVTLTYDDKHLPSDGSVDPKHIQDWLKRFRKAVHPMKVRYFVVGEYGDESERPHYHAAIFGYPSCVRGTTLRGTRGDEPGSHRCCGVCSLVSRTWGKGLVDVGKLEAHSAGYVAGYVTKKMTRFDDPRLKGRHPEFARMSLRPGIGADAMDEIASVLMTHNLEDRSDVPSSLRHGRTELPLGRYLQRRLRKLVGREESAPQSVADKMDEELRPLREAAKASSEEPSVLTHYKRAHKGRIAQFDARQRIFKQRKTL